MIFDPQKYAIEDRKNVPFIDSAEIRAILAAQSAPGMDEIEKIVDKSLSRQRLSMHETATLIAGSANPAVREKILAAARVLKQAVYGNRIVLFAPLYIGNNCINNCSYCGFRRDNKNALRRTLTDEEIVGETRSIEDAGHKRLILVYGEHPAYTPQYIAHTVKLVYGVKSGGGEIRRVNINAAPLDTEGFRTVKSAGIGTYQIFQETYDRESYAKYHPSGRKADYDWRLTALDRAMDAGIDDVGIGVLLGLHSWREELLALVRHANHLEACYGVGPHTISFPRVKKASGVCGDIPAEVGDEDFTTFVAILRLAVPYAGLILTAREPAALRDTLIRYGVSQIDGGTRLEIGGYSENGTAQNLDREQFSLDDERTLSEVVESLVAEGRIPSFCTACYRKGRTGEHFMEFSTAGFIKRYCTPNAILTFAEYLEDYASGREYEQGWKLIENELKSAETQQRLERIKAGERDFYY